MSFQILNIVIYSKSGEIRSLEFKPNRVNIITGQRGSGKSILIKILEYCFASQKCYVDHGVVRKNASWYGVRVQAGRNQMFIARKNPDVGALSSEDIYIAWGGELEIPTFDLIKKNANLITLISHLNVAVNILANVPENDLGVPSMHGTTNIRDAIKFCFQREDEIASQSNLFHSQSEDFVAPSIKAHLPFFLGAVPITYIQDKAELTRVKRELKAIEFKVEQQKVLLGENFDRAHALLNEAISVGLMLPLDTLPTNWDDIRSYITESLSQKDNGLDESGDHILNQLMDKRHTIRTEIRLLDEELDALKSLQYSSNSFSNETLEQRARLESIKLFPKEQPQTCPLCQNHIAVKIPSVSEIMNSLLDVNQKLEAVVNNTPHIGEMIENLKDKLSISKESLQQINSLILAQQNSNMELSHLKELDLKQTLTKGKLSLYLESLPNNKENDLTLWKASIIKLENSINLLTEKISNDEIKNSLNHILSVISNQITAQAKKLDIPYAENPIRLDINKLTLIADAPEEAIPMNMMGGGSYTVGLHLITHLVLHNWFASQERPVPNFIFFDQPSQSYFPKEQYTAEEIRRITSGEQINDLPLVKQMFQYIIEETKNFQVIITEHANLNDSWYQDLIIENWWAKDAKLIPCSWFEDQEDQEDQD